MCLAIFILVYFFHVLCYGTKTQEFGLWDNIKLNTWCREGQLEMASSHTEINWQKWWGVRWADAIISKPIMVLINSPGLSDWDTLISLPWPSYQWQRVSACHFLRLILPFISDSDVMACGPSSTCCCSGWSVLCNVMQFHCSDWLVFITWCHSEVPIRWLWVTWKDGVGNWPVRFCTVGRVLKWERADAG